MSPMRYPIFVFTCQFWEVDALDPEAALTEWRLMFGDLFDVFAWSSGNYALVMTGPRTTW
jgi:hypothetical protein